MILADTDTVFQCTPDELLTRFEALGAPLVVGAERWWFPRPHFSRGAFDPFERACSSRGWGLSFPNSGLLMGTRKGFTNLVRSIRKQPGFPCCRQIQQPKALMENNTNEQGKECFVDDQACMQAALLNNMRIGTWSEIPPPLCDSEEMEERRSRARGRRRRCRRADRRWKPKRWCEPPREQDGLQNETLRRRPLPTSFRNIGADATPAGVILEHHLEGTPDYVLDVRASLFLNLFLVYPRELGVNPKGQIIYKKTGLAPCVIHTNAYKSPDQLVELLENWTHITWVPSNATRLQRLLMRRMRRTWNVGMGMPKRWHKEPMLEVAVPTSTAAPAREAFNP